MHKLILASESPRRKKILQEAHFSFEVFPVKVSENIEKNLTSETEINAEIQRIALTKAQACQLEYSPSDDSPYLIVSADTMVVHGHHPLGKPKSSAQAVEFLTRLSNSTHLVKTAVCILDTHWTEKKAKTVKIIEFIETTKVSFRLISRQEILDYVASGEPMDKAGAYAIQGEGRGFVQEISGSFENVVGFPIEQFQKVIKTYGYQIGKTEI